MAPRLDLQDLLVELLGSSNVYFQPPETVEMDYPCIVYARDFVDSDHADNTSYKSYKRYLVTYIDQDPDSEVPDKIKELPMCAYDRFFTADNLNHDVFRLFF